MSDDTLPEVAEARMWAHFYESCWWAALKDALPPKAPETDPPYWLTRSANMPDLDAARDLHSATVKTARRRDREASDEPSRDVVVERITARLNEIRTTSTRYFGPDNGYWRHGQYKNEKKEGFDRGLVEALEMMGAPVPEGMLDHGAPFDVQLSSEDARELIAWLTANRDWHERRFNELAEHAKPLAEHLQTMSAAVVELRAQFADITDDEIAEAHTHPGPPSDDELCVACLLLAFREALGAQP